MDQTDQKSIEDWLEARPPERSAPRGRITLGEMVDDWRVEAYLGMGRSAEVYRVVNARSAREGALKILVDETCGLRERFNVEMDALRFLRLKCLPQFYGNGVWRGRPYYVMEYLQPLLLPLPEGEVEAFIVAVARAVRQLHKAGYVHRDLKPGNVLRRVDGTPVLIDLGLVKKMDDGDGTSTCRPSQLSLVNGRPVGVGTLDFAAPEQLLKGESSVRSDVFSLGKLLKCCFDGRPPRRWEAIVRRATQEAPGDRYESAVAFATAVRRRNVPRILAGSAVAALVAVLGVGVVVLPRILEKPSRAEDAMATVARVPDAGPEVLLRRHGESWKLYLERLLPIAEKDNVAAQLLVAEAYFYGRGTETNREEAVKWYGRAAAQDDPNAQASMGLCALRGWGCEQNYDVAAEWYLKAAESGHLGAMSDLAFCYMNGYGVEKDPGKGFDWAMKSAQKGHPPAQVLVAECYLQGLGTVTNSVRADEWLQAAARQGNKRALMLLEALR